MVKEWIRKIVAAIIHWAIREDYGNIASTFVDVVNQISDVDKKVDKNDEYWHDKWADNEARISEASKTVLNFLGDKENHCVVDYHEHEPSWAMIHLSGRKGGGKGYFKFVRLDENMRLDEIIHFLKHFEYCDIDAPFNMKGYVQEFLFD